MGRAPSTTFGRLSIATSDGRRGTVTLARRLLAAGLASNHAWALAISADQVRAELEVLRREEAGGLELVDSSEEASLMRELPTAQRCEQVLREMQVANRTVDGTTHVKAWEDRLYEAAVQVAGSETKAAHLLQIKPRTLNARRAKR